MTDNGSYLTPEVLHGLARMDVPCPTGLYQIRKLGPAEMSEIGAGIDLTHYLEKGEPNPKKSYTEEQQRNILSFQDRVVARGISSMRVFVDKADQGDGEIWIGDVPGEDKHKLFPAILVFAGNSKEEAAKLIPLSDTPES